MAADRTLTRLRAHQMAAHLRAGDFSALELLDVPSDEAGEPLAEERKPKD